MATPPPPTNDNLEVLRGVARLSGKARRIVKVVGYILAGLFAFIQFKGFPLGEALERSDPHNILQVTLVLMYFSWVYGLNFDIAVKEKVYVGDPRRGNLSLSAYSYISIFVGMAIILLFSRDNERYFAIALTAFSLISIILMIMVNRRTNPLITYSREVYSERKDMFGVEQVNLMEIYESGSWVWKRTMTLIVLLLFVDAMCLTDNLKDAITATIRPLVGDLFTEITRKLLPITSIILFLLVAEAWQWLMRLRTGISVHLLGELRKRFELTVKQPG